jgi:hypothetical protein
VDLEKQVLVIVLVGWFVLKAGMLILIVCGFVKIRVTRGWQELVLQKVDVCGWIAVVMTVIEMLLLQLLRQLLLMCWQHLEIILVKDGLKIIKQYLC